MTGPPPELPGLPPRDPTEVTAELARLPEVDFEELPPEEDTQILTLAVEDDYLGLAADEDSPPELDAQEENERVSVQLALARAQIAEGIELLHGGIEILQRVDGLAQVGGKEHAHLMGAIRTVRAEQLEGLLRPGGLQQQITDAGSHWLLPWVEKRTGNHACALVIVGTVTFFLGTVLMALTEATPILLRALISWAGSP